ncbi:FHA domain-containing protein [Sessilibacter sp. MAH1]
MARIKHLLSGREFELRSHHTLGRRADIADTPIAGKEVSKIHASLEYLDSSWRIKDLSMNGTWLNGNKLDTGRPEKIQSSDTFYFAGIQDDLWQLVDDSAPANKILVTNAPERSLILENYNLLPSEADPSYALYFDNSQQAWTLEKIHADDTHQTEYLHHNSTFSVDGEMHQLFLCGTLQATQKLGFEPPTEAPQLTLTFDVSQDEENITLVINDGQQQFDLGERSHHEILLYLAREKLKHVAENYVVQEQGWCRKTVISQEVGLEESHINILIFRARKQISEASNHSLDSSTIIERKRGKIRLSVDNIIINKSTPQKKSSATNTAESAMETATESWTRSV